MDCTNEQDEGCKGMILSRTKKEVIVSEDSCYPGTLKVMYINTLLFEDGTSIVCDDEIVFCGDRKMLLDVYTAIANYFKEIV